MTETANLESIRIKLGTGLKTASDFRIAIYAKGLQFSDYTNGVLENSEFTVATALSEVELVVMSVRDLGFECDTSFNQICARAKELGLELCPAEVGPQLCLQSMDTLKSEWRMIAMKAIGDQHGSLKIFGVGFRALAASVGFANFRWTPEHRFVFASSQVA